METIAIQQAKEPVEQGASDAAENFEHDRDVVKRMIHSEVNAALEDDLKKAIAILKEQQHQAIQQIVESRRAAIRQIIDEEKQQIWVQARSIL